MGPGGIEGSPFCRHPGAPRLKRPGRKRFPSTQWRLYMSWRTIFFFILRAQTKAVREKLSKNENNVSVFLCVFWFRFWLCFLHFPLSTASSLVHFFALKPPSLAMFSLASRTPNHDAILTKDSLRLQDFLASKSPTFANCFVAAFFERNPWRDEKKKIIAYLAVGEKSL